MVTNSQSCSMRSLRENRIFWNFGQFLQQNTITKKTKVHLPLMLRNAKIIRAFAEKQNDVFLVVTLINHDVFVHFFESIASSNFKIKTDVFRIVLECLQHFDVGFFLFTR